MKFIASKSWQRLIHENVIDHTACHPLFGRTNFEGMVAVYIEARKDLGSMEWKAICGQEGRPSPNHTANIVAISL